jgi:hypothetical protein
VEPRCVIVDRSQPPPLNRGATLVSHLDLEPRSLPAQIKLALPRLPPIMKKDERRKTSE